MKKNPPPSSRAIALSILVKWEARRDKELEALFTDGPASSDPHMGAQARELVYGVVRWRSKLDWYLDRLLKRPRRRLPPGLVQLLRIGLYQLRPEGRIPPAKIVSECVEEARHRGWTWAAGLTNGLLRTFLRSRDALEAALAEPTDDNLALRYAHPPWMVRRLKAVAGETIENLLKANQRQPHLTMRVNTLRADLEEVLDELRPFDAQKAPYAPAALKLSTRGAVPLVPGFREGRITVQDEASQLVSHLLAPRPGEEVLDACAAPGGKSAHLAALMGNEGRVHAVDRAAAKLERIEENRIRLGATGIHSVLFDWIASPDADRPSSWPRRFDAVLVDAPCTALGIIRRHPEIKWRREPADVTRNASRQLAIMTRAASHLRRGGRLVFSVCSPLREESVDVVGRFLAHHPDFRRVDPRPWLPPVCHAMVGPDAMVRTRPDRHDCDAFTMIRLERTC